MNRRYSKPLYLISGLLLSVSTHAENEALIINNGNTSQALIEQFQVTGQEPVSAIINQNNTDTMNAYILQAPNTGDASLDPDNLEGQSTYAQDNGITIDLTDPLYSPSLGYTITQHSVSNFALIKSDGSSNGNSFILQATANDIASFPFSLVNPDFSLTNSANNPIGLDGTGKIHYDFTFYDTGTGAYTNHQPASYTPTNTDSYGNIALISQGGLPVDRDGNQVGFASAQGAVADTVQALVIQTGINNMAVIQQAGDNTFAAILQDGNNNDAYIAQDNTGLSDSATAEIVQIGDDNVATITQGGNSGDDIKSDWSIVQTGTNNSADIKSVGDNNVYSVQQTGSNNIAYLYQGYDPNNPSNPPSCSSCTAIIIQAADNDLATIIQFGTNQSATIYQH